MLFRISKTTSLSENQWSALSNIFTEVLAIIPVLIGNRHIKTFVSCPLCNGIQIGFRNLIKRFKRGFPVNSINHHLPRFDLFQCCYPSFYLFFGCIVYLHSVPFASQNMVWMIRLPSKRQRFFNKASKQKPGLFGLST